SLNHKEGGTPHGSSLALQPGPCFLKRHLRCLLEILMATTQLANSVQQVEYALGHTSRELDRLSVQAALLEPFTRQLFHEAGILPGMRVLDVGCGSGDVSLLAAEVVGDYGAVVGVDRSPDAISRASARAFLRNRSNVTFERGDLSTISFDEPFD